MQNEFLSIKEASAWVSEELQKDITSSNISYLVNYGRIRKYGENGNILIRKNELLDYYKNYNKSRIYNWKDKLGEDINWHLSFENYKESQTTKHVHRLHPYKGKFIPQLVEYFLDDKTDEFKRESFFKKGDIVLDPFCGSGTTLVQANELGLHAIGIDVSAFNTLISNVKIGHYDFYDIEREINSISKQFREYVNTNNIQEFDQILSEELSKFNNSNFPSPEYKRKLISKEIIEEDYSKDKEREFLLIYNKLISEFNIQLNQKNNIDFLDKWYIPVIRKEIDFLFELIKKIKSPSTKKLMSIILSRTIRSCRATSHSDLATLKEPIFKTYYCSKHGKICKPLFSIIGWWERYSRDTIKRLKEFNKIKTLSFQHCFTGDSRNLNILQSVERFDEKFSRFLKTKKIKGIFTSPPYVGLINYHEQHEYAYELFGFERLDMLEIGPLYKGQGQAAKESYISGISDVLKNSMLYLQNDFNIFIVANDKYNLYPKIAEICNLRIINQFKRPVINRTEKDKSAYSESIFHLKAKI